MILHKYRVFWHNGEEEREAEFWLPKGDNPKIHVGSFLNLVELDSDDTGYKYKIENIGEVNCD